MKKKTFEMIYFTCNESKIYESLIFLNKLQENKNKNHFQFFLDVPVYIYIYIYAFSRRFYPKRLTLHSSYSFYILSGLDFPGNRTHDLGVASAMLYQLSYRKAVVHTYILIISNY